MWCNSNNTEAIQIYINTIFHIYNSMKGRSKFISKVIVLTFNFTLEYKKERVGPLYKSRNRGPRSKMNSVSSAYNRDFWPWFTKFKKWYMVHGPLASNSCWAVFFRNAYSWGPLQTYLLICSSKGELWSLTFQKCHGRFLTYSNFLKILKDHQWLNKDNIYRATTRCKLFAVLYRNHKRA